MIQVNNKDFVWIKIKIIINLAWSFLRPRYGGSGSGVYLFGATFGIAVSLIPLVLVMEISDGLIEGITERYLELGSYHLQISLPNILSESVGFNNETVAALAESIQSKNPEVILAVHENQGVALAVTKNAQKFVTIRSLAKNLYLNDQGFKNYLEMHEGKFDITGDGVVVAKAVAESLSLKLSDKLVLITERVSNESDSPIIVPLTVRGIFTTGYQELDKLWVFISSETGKEVLSDRSSRNFIGLKVKDPFQDFSQITDKINRSLGRFYLIRTWKEIEKNSYESFATSQALLILIMSLIVLVACVNVTSASVTLSLSRRKEIAYLKCLGLSPAEVFLSVVFAGFFVGIVGSIIGVSAGLLISININDIVVFLEKNLTIIRDIISGIFIDTSDSSEYSSVIIINKEYYLQKIPINVEFLQIAATIFGTVLFSVIATIFSAYHTAKIPPKELLNRSELY